MAKKQDLTLNFSKLNGVCGQLKCCLQYEDEVYREERSRLPKEGDFISTHTGEIGRVDRLHLLSEQFVMMTNRGVRKRYVVDLYKDTLKKEEANFPLEFESVSDETFKVIGMDEAEAKKVMAFEAEAKKMKEPSKQFADTIFESLFGEKSLDYSLPDLKEPEGTYKKAVINPEEEEEIAYTMSADDMLDEDDESLSRPGGQSGRQQPQRHDNRGGRPQGQHNNQNQNPNRNQNQNQNQNNPNQNRGPRNPR